MRADLRELLLAANVPLWRRLLYGLLSLLVATAIWFPCVHVFFRPRVQDYFAPTGVAPQSRALAARHLEFWTRPELKAQEIAKMRGSNAEWDFMGRTFLVLALANMSLREPERKEQYLQIVDQIIDETVRLETKEGMYFFLMDYARSGRYLGQPPRSLFLDGEIALMLGARRLVQERADYRPQLAARVKVMVEYMGKGPAGCAESYPDECWMFDHSVALAAMRIADVLDGSDHSAFAAKWLQAARAKLTDKKTGLLISSCTYHGEHCDGPEGSTIFMVAHCLQLVDEDFARDQYERAKKELRCEILGFGYAREWPVSWKGAQDIDSGPIIPIVGASAGASGLAFVGASSFHDETYLAELLTTLHLGAFPVQRGGTLKFCASNQVGDAVLLYATVLGPLWQKVREKEQHGR